MKENSMLVLAGLALLLRHSPSTSQVQTSTQIPQDVAQNILNSQNATQALAIGNKWLESLPHVTVNIPTGVDFSQQGLDLASPLGEVAPPSINTTGERWSSQFSTGSISNDTWKAAGFTFSGEGTLNMAQASWRKSSLPSDLVQAFEQLGGTWQQVLSPSGSYW